MFSHKKNKNIFVYILSFVFSISGLFLLNSVFWQDLMEQAFMPAMSYDTVIKIGNTKNAVWNTVLRETMTVEMWDNIFKDACFINNQIQNWIWESKCIEMWWERRKDKINISAKAPLIVRITKFLLRMTIVLSITMIIFNAVKYMIEVLWWKDRKSAEAKKNLVFVAGWIILSLMSVSIINLIVSVPKSSIKTSDDLSAFEIGCKTWSTILVGNDLRKQICLISTFGHPQWTMQYRERDYLKPFSMSADSMEDPVLWWYRCKICEWNWNNFWENCKRKKIYNSEMESKCVEDLWWSVVK